MTRDVAQRGAEILSQIRSLEGVAKGIEKHKDHFNLNCGMNHDIEEQMQEIWDKGHDLKLKLTQELLAKKNNELKNLK